LVVLYEAWAHQFMVFNTGLNTLYEIKTTVRNLQAYI